ncbi:hypothetical protein BDB00DRAFT_784290 [Zychaea mexicana]|uniref:uncharacterized protein n=1 Tax=Zychaea mexicana TaxID=64656 RepID=UPI0022FE00DC|nr:uncharacterized protein BDB00DRAFT_784290 [Zychaea mexicana]KAI9498231.1 hypothetical protein BDB00DRAFT_784290 [Zychaea mexicana]
MKSENTPSPPITQQADSYLAENPDNDPATSVYSIFVGINDMIANEAPNDVISCIQSQITRLNQQVQGKQFLIFNMVPFDHSPRIIQDNQANSAAQWIDEFNQNLHTSMSSLQQQYSNLTIVVIDTHATLLNVLNHPADFGITKGVTDYYTHVSPDPGSSGGQMLQNGNKYFWFDNAHITSIVHEQISKAVVAQQPFPYLPLMGSPSSPSNPMDPHYTSPPSTASSTAHRNYALATFLIALALLS